MKIAIYIVKHTFTRLLVGGFVSGALVSVVFIGHAEIAIFAVPFAVISGAYFCNTLGRILEELVHGIFLLILILVVRFWIPDSIADDHQEAVFGFLGAILGILGGKTAGGIAGAICRQVWDPLLQDESPSDI